MTDRIRYSLPKTLFAARTLRIAPFVLVTALLAACTAADWRTDFQMARDRANAYITAHPALDARTRDAIRRANVFKGMSKVEVVAAWGRPVIVQKFRGGTQEFWYFGCHWPHICTDSDSDNLFPNPDEIFQSRALFEGGKLVDWQS